MTEIDELLRRYAAEWRAAEAPPPAPRSPELTHRSRRRRALVLAAAGAVAIALIVAIAIVASGPTATRVATGDTTSGTTTKVPSCALPSLPRDNDPSLPEALSGPAVSSLRGGAAQTAFELDDGGLIVTPPTRHDRPVLSANQAECAALASLEPNGLAVMLAAQVSGIAIGYARVTVAARLIAAPPTSVLPPSFMHMNQNTYPQLPPPAAYQNRLAWVVVVEDEMQSTCPLETSPPSTAPASPDSYFYTVFLLDAATGSDALIYNESVPNPCGFPGRVSASVGVPAEQTSVPWTLEA
ncbi:MAG: hypothetical protein ACRDYC_05535, partial [Acidimicrobiales bacterium]